MADGGRAAEAEYRNLYFYKEPNLVICKRDKKGFIHYKIKKKEEKI